MFDILLKQMMPPGFDLDATIKQVTAAIQTTVATVQRIEAKQDELLAAIKTVQAATVPVPYPESNHDHAQHSESAGNPVNASGSADPGTDPAAERYASGNGYCGDPTD